MSRTRRSGLVMALLCACGDPTPHFSVESAPDFVQRPATVSVLGVFREGRMSLDGWDQIGPGVSSVLHEGLCPAGYEKALHEQRPDLADAIDRGAREEGLNDDLLDKIAPMAQGELVMVVTLYHYLPPTLAHSASTAAPPPTPAHMPGRGGGGGFAGGRQGFAGTPPVPEEESVFEVSASLFSVKLHHLVAQIDMRYSGADTDHAMTQFQARLGALLPKSHCVGWSWAPAATP